MNDKETEIDRWKSIIATRDIGPMMETLQQRVISVADGEAVVEGTPGSQFNNYQGRIHGGYLAALIDTAMGWSVATKMQPETGFGTIDMSVKYVRKFEVATGPVLATARVVHAGRTMVTTECKVADKAGVLYAHGLGTFLVYPK
jgi:acyl-CoA thioesterase